MELAIEATGLSKRFGSTQALAGVDLAVPTGTVLGVLGPNGAGKTTAVRILATLLRADSGTARVAGYDVVHQAQQVRQQIGLTGQYASVDEDLTGVENLVLIGQLLDLPTRAARARARELLGWFGLAEAANRQAKTYSGGMRRRLDLAASLVGRPAVIFLDEPTTGLDPAKREDMWDVIRTLVADGSTVLLTTQYLDEADALADRITVFDQGRVIATDTPDGLKRIVGGQTLRVRPADPGRLDEVRAILAEVAGGRGRSGRTATGRTAAPMPPAPMPPAGPTGPVPLPSLPGDDRAAAAGRPGIAARSAAGNQPQSPARGVLSVPVDGDEALAVVVGRLGAAGIAVTELSLHLPSLDEVFFTLTGGRAATTEAVA